MAKIEYRICDRCGEKINPHHKTESTIYFKKPIRIVTRLFQYVTDRSLELCGECTEGLDKYLYRKGVMKDE